MGYVLEHYHNYETKKEKAITVLGEILELMALNDPFGVAIDSGMTRKMPRIVVIFG